MTSCPWGLEISRTHGMARRQDLLAVEEGEGQVEGVARPPDAALAVEDALDALLGDLAADVEMAQGQGAFAGDAQVADVAAALRRNVEGPVLEGEDGEAVGVARRFAEELVLVVVGPDAQAGRAAWPCRCRSSRRGGSRSPRAWPRARCPRKRNCGRRRPRDCSGGCNRRRRRDRSGGSSRRSCSHSPRHSNPSSNSGRSRRRPCS